MKVCLNNVTRESYLQRQSPALCNAVSMFRITPKTSKDIGGIQSKNLKWDFVNLSSKLGFRGYFSLLSSTSKKFFRMDFGGGSGEGLEDCG